MNGIKGAKAFPVICFSYVQNAVFVGFLGFFYF